VEKVDWKSEECAYFGVDIKGGFARCCQKISFSPFRELRERVELVGFFGRRGKHDA
jgi:hypothetical protein